MSSSSKPKIILDTNAFISAYLFSGMENQILNLVEEEKLILYFSNDLANEVIYKLNTKFKAEIISEIFVLFVNEFGIYFQPKTKLELCRDPKDNFLLDLCLESQADFLITRDKDLLELNSNSLFVTKVLKPEEFLPLLRKVKVS